MAVPRAAVNNTATLPHPLAISDFRAYLMARFAMTLGQYAMMLVIGWQTYNYARNDGTEHPRSCRSIGADRLAAVYSAVPPYALLGPRRPTGLDRRRLAQATYPAADWAARRHSHW
jgi:hypothetical protein